MCVCKREWRAGSTEDLGMTSTSRKHMEVNTRSPVPKPSALPNHALASTVLSCTLRKETADRLVVWGNTPTGSPLLLIERCLWQQRARLKQYQTQKVKAVLSESSGVHIGKYVLETGFKRGKESEALPKTLNIYLWNKW